MSGEGRYPKDYICTLHSTMFLLIPGRCPSASGIFSAFTFHYVSINTTENDMTDYQCGTLHSTMFLLIRNHQKHRQFKRYSLHSTMFLLILSTVHLKFLPSNLFTFHYVSINTVPLFLLENFVLSLYIPLCFY